MDLRQLRYFLKVCEQGSIAEAARSLHIAQPALSRQIAALEESLKARLFIRLPRGVALTRAGSELRWRAGDILTQTQALEEQVQTAARGTTGVLRIGVMPGYSWLPQLAEGIVAVQRAFPSVEVYVETMRSVEQQEQIREHDLDLGIVVWRSPYDASYAGLTLMHDELAVAIPSHWPQATKADPVCMQDLASLPLLMCPRDKSPVTYDTVIEACVAAGFDPRPFRIAVVDVATMAGMVAAGLGYAVVPLSFREQWQSKVCFRKVEGLNIPLKLELIWRAHSKDPLVKHFVQIMSQRLRSAQLSAAT